MDVISGLGRRGKTIALSPHLDDAVLSAGAYLAGRAASGKPTSVVSVYTAGPDPSTLLPRLRVFGDYSTRLDEDDRALALLGIEAERLGLPERIFRDPPLTRLTQVFRTPTSATDFEELSTVRDAIIRILADRDVEVLAPLGVGNHVDHVEVTVAALQAAAECDAFDRVWFYEDFYALSEMARRRHPVTAQNPLPIRLVPGWASPLTGLRTECIALFGRGPSSSQLVGANLEWSPYTARTDGREHMKLAAIAAYGTQTAELGGPEQLKAMIRRAHAGRGGEVFWSASPL